MKATGTKPPALPPRVSQAERERLETIAGGVEAYETALAEAQRVAETRVVELRAAQEARQSLPPTETSKTYPCPHCGEPVAVRGNLLDLVLEKPDRAALDDAEVKRRRLAVADHDGKVARANDNLNLARQAISNAQREVEAARTARERLANWPAKVETATDIDAARAELSRAEKRLAEFRAKVEADDIHQKIESNDVILGLLAGDGLRARKLACVLDVFVNQQLKALTDAAGWPERIGLDADMALSLDGRPYVLLSKSEKYRVRVVLQIAMACLEGADLIVIDEADVLDGPTRGGLFSMLDQASVPALVCMTLSRPDQLPDLAAAELGASYWLDAGASAPLRPEAAAA